MVTNALYENILTSTINTINTIHTIDILLMLLILIPGINMCVCVLIAGTSLRLQ